MPTSNIPPIHKLSLNKVLKHIVRNRLGLLQRVEEVVQDIGIIQIGPLRVLVVNESDLVHSVFVENATKLQKSATLRGKVRTGNRGRLLKTHGVQHRYQRQRLAPTFTVRRGIDQADVITQLTIETQQSWSDGDTIDAADTMLRLTIKIVGRMLFNDELLHPSPRKNALVRHKIRDFTDYISSPTRILANWPLPPTRDALTRINEIVSFRITSAEAVDCNQGDLLSQLLAPHDASGDYQINPDEVRAEAINVFLAGHESTASVIAWTLYLLASHLDVYQKVQHELYTVLKDRVPTPNDLPNLPYLHQVVKEVIRLYPPSHLIMRQAIEDISMGTFDFPKGCLIAVSPYLLHRRSDYFADPLKFDPQRFTSENEKQIPRYGYLPFGSGPRHCIGRHFATLLSHLVIATLVQRVNFHLVPDQIIEPESTGFTLQPINGIHMTVERRQN